MDWTSAQDLFEVLTVQVKKTSTDYPVAVAMGTEDGSV